MQGMYPAFVKNLRVRGREGRERERETDRQTHRQAGRQTDRQTKSETNDLHNNTSSFDLRRILKLFGSRQ